MMNDKKILAIETSGELCSVSLSFEYGKYDERNILMKHIHSEKLIPMIDEVLSSNKISTKELDCVAVSVGPGSFTGLRIGMTAAKGIAFASNLPLIPVPSFDALSLEISNYLLPNTTFCIVNNANIEECYYANYQNEPSGPRSIKKVSLLKKSEIATEIQNSDMIFGNLNTIERIKNISSPKASSVAKWSYLYGEDLLTFDYDYLEPNYLKKFKVKQKK
jgi:tRNA threonylcarbamoyladenosine biosynthesis protein TsaB